MKVGSILKIKAIMIICLFGLSFNNWSVTEGKAHLIYTITEVSYESEGVKISAAIWLPNKQGRHPAIVLGHGSGRSTKENGNNMARHFVEMGFAVLIHDKRGVGKSGGTYVGNNNGSEGNLTLLAKDIAAGVDYLRKRSDIDKDQIGLWGVSQAGWIIPIVTSIQKNIKFTILISGPTVTVGEENYYSDLTGDGSITLELSQQEISQKLIEKGPYGFNPVPFLKQMNAPGLWLLGDADKSIPIPETVSILDDLIQKSGKDFKYTVFKNANHGLRANGQRVKDYWKVQDEFLLNYVKINFESIK